MLVSERPRLALELMDAGGLLQVVLPELAACKGVEQSGYHTHDVYGHTLLALDHVPGDLVLRLAALFHDVGKPSTANPDGAFPGHENVGADLARSALERLRFSQKEIDTVVKLGTLKGSETPADSYTDQFLAACNDFDRAAVVAQAKGMSQ